MNIEWNSNIEQYTNIEYFSTRLELSLLHSEQKPRYFYRGSLDLEMENCLNTGHFSMIEVKIIFFCTSMENHSFIQNNLIFEDNKNKMFLSKMLNFEHYVGYISDIWKKCLLGTAFEFILSFSCVYTARFSNVWETTFYFSYKTILCFILNTKIYNRMEFSLKHIY